VALRPAPRAGASALTTEVHALERWRVTVLAGGVLGFLIGGVGGRLAMLLLRITSPDSVRGIESDDGFTIGQFSFDTFFLLAVASGAGVVGALLYRLLAPALAGSPQVRRLVVAAAAAVIGGGLLINPGGVDFTLLEPIWLAVILFIAIPGLFGLAIVPLVQRWSAPDAWVNRGRVRPWVLPVPILVASSFLLPFVLVGAAMMVAWAALDRIREVHNFRQGLGRTLARVAWSAFGAFSVFILIDDLVTL
jgi:hypothetical protein